MYKLKSVIITLLALLGAGIVLHAHPQESNFGGSFLPGPLYVGSSAADNGTDSITGILISGTSMQSNRDQIGLSLASIWAPNAASPTNPFHFGYDSLVYTGLSAANSVASTTVTAMGAFTANWGLTASSGKTVVATDGVGYVANAPTFVGAGAMSYTRNSGFWANNQGNANIGTSYGFRCDAQSGSTTTSYCFYTSGTGPNHLGDRLETSGAERAIAYHNSAYPVVNTDETILCDTTSAGFTITLPTAANALHGTNGGVFTIKKIDSTANVCTVSSNGSFIDASATYVGLSAQYKYVVVQSNGTQYFVIGNN